MCTYSLTYSKNVRSQDATITEKTDFKVVEIHKKGMRHERTFRCVLVKFVKVDLYKKKSNITSFFPSIDWLSPRSPNKKASAHLTQSKAFRFSLFSLLHNPIVTTKYQSLAWFSIMQNTEKSFLWHS